MSVRILLLNNYSMRSALSRVRRGTYPEQHLYGFPAHSSERGGMEWVLPRRSLYDLPFGRNRVLGTIRSAILRSIGDPLQQIDALNPKRVDVIFSADQWSGRTLLVLKRLRLLRRPVVVFVHHRPRGALQRWILRAADGLGFFGDYARSAFDAAKATTILPWGPELDSAVYVTARGSDARPALDFVSAGKTNRDYTALHRAAIDGRLAGVIYDGECRTTYERGDFVRAPMKADYPEILADMVRAKAVVVPIGDPKVMAGLTEVADAIALDKPIIVTESIAFPYNLGELHAGVVISADDPTHLLTALKDAALGKHGSAGAMADRFNGALYRATLDGLIRTALLRSVSRRPTKR